MSATYNELLPTDLDRARSLLGDTTVSPASAALHSNEHITAVLAAEGSFAAGVAYLADELVARFSRKPGSVRLPNGLSVSYAERVAFWKALASRMRTQAASAQSTSVAAPSGGTCSEVVW